MDFLKRKLQDHKTTVYLRVSKKKSARAVGMFRQRIKSNPRQKPAGEVALLKF